MDNADVQSNSILKTMDSIIWQPLYASSYLSMAYIIIDVDKMQANLFYTKTCLSIQLIQLINNSSRRLK